CNKEEATVFCTADEAALCDACDHRVHHANKLASKHQRFTLLHPCSSSKQVPLCDICQVIFKQFHHCLENFVLEFNVSIVGISEYLIEMLPGWHVEDLLDSSPSLSPFGFCKNDDGMLPFSDPSQSLYHLPQMEGPIGFKETTMKGNKRWTNDAFTVPQINPPPTV
ncbi:hypothetical protein Gotri_005071, partial [Gossypium trilobum]|nr:hypothetical protein [Gossypium trilobum]